MHQVETGCVRGEIMIHHYSYDEKQDRTFVNVSATAYWLKPPLFQMTDFMTIVVKGSDAAFAKLNASSSACYRHQDDETNWFVYDIFGEDYQSFDEVRYRLPVKLKCGEENRISILQSVTLIYHGFASGKISLIEVTSCYEHQAFRPLMDFSLIGALTTLGSASPIEILPTVTLTGEFPTSKIWCKVMRAELTEGNFESQVTEVQRGENVSETTYEQRFELYTDAASLVR